MKKKRPPRVRRQALARPAARSLIQTKPSGVPLAVHVAVQTFERLAGGRQALIEALSIADASPEVAKVLCAIGQDQAESRYLSEVCQAAAITPGELFRVFGVAAKTRAKILAAIENAKRTPEVVKVVGETALPHQKTCYACNGVTTIVPPKTRKNPNPEPERCSTCNGVGTLPIDGSLEHQRLVLEMADLLKKPSGTQILNQQVNQAPAIGGLGGTLEQLQQAVSETLFGRQATAVDAEPIPPTPQDP